MSTVRAYAYRALDAGGEAQDGTLEAVDQASAVRELRANGLFVLDLVEQADQRSANSLADFSDELAGLLPVSSTRKVFFFKQLALLLRSGISITEALDIMRNMQRGAMGRTVSELAEDLRSGSTLSQAMARHEKIFSKLATRMVAASEQSGELELALLRIAAYLEQRAEIKKQILAAMLYPVFTLIAALGVFAFMLFYIIPKFQAFLERSGRKIPPTTQLMVDIGEFATNRWQETLVVLVLLVIGFMVFHRQPQGRLTTDRTLLRIPVIGPAIQSAAMAQFAWGLGMLVKSGVPIVDALRTIAQIVNNKAIAGGIDRAAASVLEGRAMGVSFENAAMSRLMHQLLMVGERSGNIVGVMEQAGDYYEEDLKTRTRTLASLVEPAAILLIGGIVGFVYAGFFQALMSVSTGR